MKRSLPGIDCCCWSILFLSIAQAIPVTKDPELRKSQHLEAINPNFLDLNKVCTYENAVYTEGQNFTTSNPCETCVCQPPAFACSLRSCDMKPGCKAIHKANKCCPEYLCECERNGRMYANGEKVEGPNPCKVCYCKGGEIKCSLITCYTRDDCEASYMPGRCCPKYDHCPPLESLKNDTITPKPALVVISDLTTQKDSDEKEKDRSFIDNFYSTYTELIEFTENSLQGKSTPPPSPIDKTTQSQSVATLEIIEIHPNMGISSTPSMTYDFSKFRHYTSTTPMSKTTTETNDEEETVSSSDETSTEEPVTEAEVTTIPIEVKDLTPIDNNDINLARIRNQTFDEGTDNSTVELFDDEMLNSTGIEEDAESVSFGDLEAESTFITENYTEAFTIENSNEKEDNSSEEMFEKIENEPSTTSESVIDESETVTIKDELNTTEAMREDYELLTTTTSDGLETTIMTTNRLERFMARNFETETTDYATDCTTDFTTETTETSTAAVDYDSSESRESTTEDKEGRYLNKATPEKLISENATTTESATEESITIKDYTTEDTTYTTDDAFERIMEDTSVTEGISESTTEYDVTTSIEFSQLLNDNIDYANDSEIEANQTTIKPENIIEETTTILAEESLGLIQFDNDTLADADIAVENISISSDSLESETISSNSSAQNVTSVQIPVEEGTEPVLVMISADQIQFLKVGEEPPIYVESPQSSTEGLKNNNDHQEIVIVPNTTPMTVEMVKVVNGKIENQTVESEESDLTDSTTVSFETSTSDSYVEDVSTIKTDDIGSTVEENTTAKTEDTETTTTQFETTGIIQER